MERPMSHYLPLAYDQLCAAYLAGQSTTSLAQRYSCSPTTIARHLRLCGITLRPARFAPAQIDEATLRRLYLEERWPIAVIAAHFGVCASTIGNQRRHHGIPIRPRQKAESSKQ